MGRAILVQQRRNTQAAKPCFHKLRKGCPSVPRGLLNEKRTSYGAAKRESVPGVEPRQHRDLTN